MLYNMTNTVGEELKLLTEKKMISGLLKFFRELNHTISHTAVADIFLVGRGGTRDDQ